MTLADFDFREGYAQLGSYRSPTGVRWIYVKRGERGASTSANLELIGGGNLELIGGGNLELIGNEAPTTLEEWIANPTTFTNVLMRANYEPSTVNRYPARAGVRAGEQCQWPSIEAAALIAAEIAIAVTPGNNLLLVGGGNLELVGGGDIELV